MRGAAGIVIRLGAVLFGLILAVLTSVVHITHTCRESSRVPVSVRQGFDEIGSQLSSTATIPSSPCQACLFLHAMHSTLAASIGVILFRMPFHDRLEPLPGLPSPLNRFVPGLRVRAPPSHQAAAALSS
jgi:hypothetical protein